MFTKIIMMLKVIGINLLVFAVYCLLIISGTSAKDLGFTIAVGIGVCIFIQVMLNIAAGIALLIFGRRDLGKHLLVSAAVMAPVCFVAWLTLLSIYG